MSELTGTRDEVRPHFDQRRTLPPGLLVMGPFRCSTSFLSHLLSERGVNFGPPEELYAADEWNPFGYFQRPDVLQANDAFVVSAGYPALAPPDRETLRQRGDVAHLRRADLDWRYDGGVWGIKDPRFCATLSAWLEAGLLGPQPALIRIRREPADSARSLLKHPELAAQLPERTLDAALQVICRFDALADEQESFFSGPVLSLAFADVIARTPRTLAAIERFIEARSVSASNADSSAHRRLEIDA